MTPIERLIAADRKSPKRIAVIGCSMEDVWVHGDLLPSQDGVQKFVERRWLSTPGGAAGAARQLCRWGQDVCLFSLVDWTESCEPWNQVNANHSCTSRRMPKKARYIDSQGRIVWRHDVENGYGTDANLMAKWRQNVLSGFFAFLPDAVLISDYEKGFLTQEMIRAVIDWCNGRKVPVVADAKREPEVYAGAVIKCNEDWRQRHRCISIGAVAVVSTRGPKAPFFFGDWDSRGFADGAPVQCVNHVGAGDCFSAHLTLALAHRMSLDSAAAVAHSAGRVYVQHPHGRPPWPHEIRKDMDSLAGKVLAGGVAALKGENDPSGYSPSQSLFHALRKSIPGKLVFTNGVFRVPHAGHASLLRWAKAQGDVLVVGLNSDASAGRIRSGKAMLPEAERAAILAAQEAVDWVVVYDEDEPTEAIKILRPDVLVKGAEYLAQQVPGSDIVSDVRFAPMIPAVRPARLIPA